MPPKKTLLKDASARFAELIDQHTPAYTTKPLPKRINLINDHTPFKKGLEGLWSIKISDMRLCSEWTNILYEIFGYTQSTFSTSAAQTDTLNYQKKDDNAQVDILEDDYKPFVNFTLRLQHLLVFMTQQMPDQKNSLMATLIEHFRNHCFQTNTLNYNHAANVCDSIGLFYATTQDSAQRLHSSIMKMTSANKTTLTLRILEQLQNNIPGAKGTVSNTHKYTPIQTRLLECILLRLRVIGINTETEGGAAQGIAENRIPDEIQLFLDKLPIFTDSRTLTTISLWLSHYNPTIESIATYLERKAKAPPASEAREAPETTAEFFSRIETAIKTNKLNEQTQEHSSTAEQTERNEAYSPLRALSETLERATPRAGGGVGAATATSSDDDTGIELRILTQVTSNQEAQEQHEVLEHTQICRIIHPTNAKNFYDRLPENQKILFLKAFLRLQGIAALEDPELKAAYQSATENKNKKSLYHPQLTPILAAWKVYARTMTALQPLLTAQKEAWSEESTTTNAHSRFRDLAELIVDYLILPEELVAYGILSSEQYNTYRRLLNFDRLLAAPTPRGALEDADAHALLLQNDIACLRANPKLWEDMYHIVTNLAQPEFLPSRPELRREFIEHYDNTTTFQGSGSLGDSLITARESTSQDIATQFFQIKKRLPPPGFALDELFKKLNIDEIIALDLNSIGEMLKDAFTPYLSDSFENEYDQIKIVRAYIEYLLAYPDFTYQEWTRPARVAYRSATFAEIDQHEHMDSHQTGSIHEPEMPDDDEQHGDLASEGTEDQEDTLVEMPISPTRSIIRPATEEDFPDDPNAQKRIKAGIAKLLRHLESALYEYEMKNSSKSKCINHTITAIYGLLFLGASAATIEFFLRLHNDPSGMNMSETEFQVVNLSGYLSRTIMGALLMKMPYMLTQKRLERIDIQETLSELKGEPSPNRKKAIIANATATLLMLIAMAAQVCIKHFILEPADRESNRNDDDSPGAKTVDKWGPIGNGFVMGAFFMFGVLAVIGTHTTIIGYKHNWGGCGKKNKDIREVVERNDDETTSNPERLSITAQDPLLPAIREQDRTTIHNAGLVRTTTLFRQQRDNQGNQERRPLLPRG